MKAIILAAGRGSRMKHLTAAKPKCLVKFRGKPLLEWQLEAIRSAGIKEVAIVTGYKRELLASFKLVEFYNPRWSSTNMVASLACAQQWLQAGPCIISYSDIFYEVSAITSLITCSAPLAVTYDPNWLSIWENRFEDPLSDAETFRIDANNKIKEIGGRASSVEEIQGQYMGLLRLTPESWGHIVNILAKLSKVSRDKIHMTGTLQNVIEYSNYPVTGVPYEDEWGEIDTYKDLMKFSIKR